MVIIKSFEDFSSHLGKDLGVSAWHTVTQEQINTFADATLDHQWIHTDPARAAVDSPFNATIAHGYLTVSLLPYFWKQIVDVQNVKLEINYGIERIKFGQPVIVNNEIRCHVKLANVVNLRGVVKANLAITVEIKDEAKPAFSGEVVFLYHFN
jgi:acyl dehydratase